MAVADNLAVMVGPGVTKGLYQSLAATKKQLITFKGQTLKPSVWLNKGESDMGREQRSRPDQDAVCFLSHRKGITSIISRGT